jgi:hypothetical protein
MVAVPVVTPFTEPAPDTVATDVLELDQVPPTIVSDMEIGVPKQTVELPVIVPAKALASI